jgi:hypothetical protein
MMALSIYCDECIAMEPISTTLTVVALKQMVTHLTKKILDKSWDRDLSQGQELLGQLSQDYAAETYAEKYVSRFLKMRTLHSAESDVYLDEVYSPLTLIVSSNKDEMMVKDGFTLSFSKIINIIGLAGQGKSTILRKLFLEEMKKSERFPFMIELRRVEDKTIMDYFKGILRDIGLSVSEGSVEILLQSKKVILMLDGFDEIPFSHRNRMLLEIIQLKTRFNCDVIVTTRPDTEICTEVDIVNLKVKKLDKSDIISILSKLDKKKEITELPTLIENNKALQETLVTPILVNLLYVCYPYLDVVPENVIDFYDKLFITLYSRHDKIKNFNRPKYSSFSSVEANIIFNALCFDSISKNILEFNETSLNAHLRTALKLSPCADVEITPLQKDLIDITCLIQRDGFDRYVFLHKSVQEFHAAKFISSLSHTHKARFYAKVIEIINREDKYDNILSFLSNLDANDYKSLFIINYFKKVKLNHLGTSDGDVILESVAESVIKDRTMRVKLIGEKKHEVFSINTLTVYSILGPLSLFKNSHRHSDSQTEDMVLRFTMNGPNERVSHKRLIEMSINSAKLSDESQHVETSYTIKMDDYLKEIGRYEEVISSLKEEIFEYYTTVFKPISINLAEVSRILDIDFDL